jgi:acetylornithine deacetylase/succinyl-diaminopimelate desuccinylase-like protein
MKGTPLIGPRTPLSLSLTICLAAAAFARTSAPDAIRVAQQVRVWRGVHQAQVINELIALLAIPNVATDTVNIPRNSAKLVEMLHARGFTTQLLPTMEGRGPVVFGKLDAPNAKRTIIFYMHYDGQPVDAATWHGTRPFEPTLRDAPFETGGKIIPIPSDGIYKDEWRLYARSSGDDKSPIVALLAAIDALRAKHIPIAVNVKVVLDGEEEAGSPHLEKTMMAHRELLGGDLLINADGPVHQSGRQLIVFGNRGIVDAQITVYGPSHSLHSGHYGNWAPNPAMRLAQLLATMKDDDGHVRIEGFYDGVVPLGPVAQEALERMPDNDAELEKTLAIAKPEGGGKKLVEVLALPSLNVDGLRSEDVGTQSRTVIPERATAAIDMRLVKNITPQMEFDRLVAHVRAQGYYVTANEPTIEERRTHEKLARVTLSGGGYPAAMTPMDLPVSMKLAEIVDVASGGNLVKMPILGGSSPQYIFENLGLPVVAVPIVNYDDNQHGPDENLQIGFFWRGIEIYGALLADMRW